MNAPEKIILSSEERHTPSWPTMYITPSIKEDIRTLREAVDVLRRTRVHFNCKELAGFDPTCAIMALERLEKAAIKAQTLYETVDVFEGLTPQEEDLLKILTIAASENQTAVISLKWLFEGTKTPSKEALRVVKSNLLKKLGPGSKEYVTTSHGRGVFVKPGFIEYLEKRKENKND